jgi:hypothetical protein
MSNVFAPITPCSNTSSAKFKVMLKKHAPEEAGGRQRRSRPFVVLTYYEYAPRVKVPAALLSEPF